jgi:hypothetical protein
LRMGLMARAGAWAVAQGEGMRAVAGRGRRKERAEIGKADAISF